MSKTVTLACCCYDRTLSLLKKKISIEGYNYAPITLSAQELFFRAIRNAEFDISEISAGSHLVQLNHGHPEYIALPIFLSRSFRFGSLYVRTDRGFTVPADLHGCRMGIPEFEMTAAIWVRGILKEHYGLDIHSLHYVTGGLNQPESIPRQTLPNLPFSITRLRATETLDRYLADGQLDAIISPSPPASYFDPTLPVGRLFENPFEEERQYFQATGIFPIMHFVGLRRSLAKSYPDLGQEIFIAFERAKQDALIQLDSMSHANASYLTLPWFEETLQQTRTILGEDFWPYGIEKNQRTLQALFRYAHEQGLTRHELTFEEIFHYVA